MLDKKKECDTIGINWKYNYEERKIRVIGDMNYKNLHHNLII